jgi:hypothetical protein
VKAVARMPLLSLSLSRDLMLFCLLSAECCAFRRDYSELPALDEQESGFDSRQENTFFVSA